MAPDGVDSLVMKLEVAWSDRPEGLLGQTLGWVILGYATLLLALLCGVLLMVAGTVLAFGQPGPGGMVLAGALWVSGLLVATFIMVCLWVRFDPPSGITLARKEHPELHALIREICGRTGAASFHRVMLDAEMNASVVQNPRLGVFGWYRSYLVIGLPLMEVLTVEEFKAVLAHEFAHVAGADGKTCAWLYRTRATWERVVAHMSSGRCCSFVARFFTRFWPRFNSRAFMLSRFSEFAADRVSASAVSAQALANGLQRLAIQGARLEEEFWEPLEARISGSDPLPSDVMERMSALLRVNPDASKAESWLAAALGKATGTVDSHPGLADRLERLGVRPCGPFPLLLEVVPPATAATELFRPGFTAEAQAVFGKEWLVKATKSRRTGSNAGLPVQDARSVREAWNRIAALCRLDGLEKIQPEVLTLLERRPNHSGALFLRGCHLAEKGDPGSARYLEQAAADPTLSVRAFETLARFHAKFGRQEETASLRERAESHERELRAALVERNQVTKNDSFLPHDLCPRELDSLRQALECETAVRRAWVGARQVQHFPSWPHLILVLETGWPAFKPTSEAAQQQLIARVLESWEVDGYVQVLRYDEHTRLILRALKRGIADSEVYRRK